MAVQLWILLALFASFSRALSAVLHKIIRTTYVQDSYAMVIVQGLLGISFIAVLPFTSVSFMDPLSILLGLLAGALAMLSYLPYYAALSTDEVSRVSPLLQLTPFLVFFLAAIFLDETLPAAFLLALVLLAAGSAIISFRHARFLPARTVFLVFLSLGLTSVAYFLLKLLSSWDTLTLLVLLALGNAGAAIFLLMLPVSRRGLRVFGKTNATGRLVFLGEYVLSILTAFLFIAAVRMGPVSLVSAVYTSYPVFVFILAAVLSFLLPRVLREDLRFPMLSQKVIGLVLAVAGIVLLYR